MSFRPISSPPPSFSTQGPQPDKNNLRVPSPPSQAESNQPGKPTPNETNSSSTEIYACSHPVKPESAKFEGSEINLCAYMPEKPDLESDPNSLLKQPPSITLCAYRPEG